MGTDLQPGRHVAATGTGALHAARTTSTDPAFRTLVAQLDQDLAVRNGDANAFFAQFNKVDSIGHVVVVSDGDTPAGCGAFKLFGDDAVEVKRMFTAPAYRQRGVASLVLHELETWARELGYRRCVLETGLMQPEAIALYKKRGYTVFPNYAPYVGVDSSLCFEKGL